MGRTPHDFGNAIPDSRESMVNLSIDEIVQIQVSLALAAIPGRFRCFVRFSAGTSERIIGFKNLKIPVWVGMADLHFVSFQNGTSESLTGAATTGATGDGHQDAGT